MSPARHVTVALAVLAVHGCGGGGSPASLSLADYSSQVVDADCARQVQCGRFVDKASCLASRQDPFVSIEADVDAGKRTFDGAAAARCADYLRGFVAAPCTYNGQAMFYTDPACTKVFVGTGAAGATCSDGGHCVSGSCGGVTCTGTPSCCVGTCDPVTPSIPNGGACPSTGSCVSGSFCRGGASGVCTPVIASGQACDSVLDVCAPGTVCANSVCSKPPGEGEPCTSLCDELADYCDFNGTGTCVRKVAVGGTCTSGGFCVDYALCDTATTTCVAKAAVGQACDANLGSSCLGGLQCVAGTCAFPDPAPVCS